LNFIYNQKNTKGDVMKNKISFIIILLTIFFVNLIFAQEEKKQILQKAAQASAKPNEQNKITLDMKGMDIVDALKILAGRADMNIVYYNAEQKREAYPLGHAPVVIGRSPEANIVITDQLVSRLHCGIQPNGNDYVLSDLGSRNGTFLNEALITEDVKLSVGDHIRLGKTVFVLQNKLD